ncbi:MAG: hypothetical protein U0905_03765 [Pirellulales bacterium]
MSSSVPGRQTAIGLVFLVLGPSTAFLFFYSPRSTSQAPTSISDVDYDQLRSGVPITSSSQNVVKPRSLPSTSGSEWSLEPSRDLQGAEQATIEEGMVNLPSRRTMLTSTEPRGLDSIKAGTTTASPGLDKSYVSKIPKPELPISIPAAQDPSTRDDMIPLTRNNEPYTSRQEAPPSRFGAGAYRPSAAPSHTLDQFPKPTPLHNTNLLKPQEGLMVPLSGPTPNASALQEPTLLNSASPSPNTAASASPPTLHSVTHVQPNISAPAALPANPTQLNALPPASNRVPQFVRQPKLR